MFVLTKFDWSKHSNVKKGVRNYSNFLFAMDDRKEIPSSLSALLSDISQVASNSLSEIGNVYTDFKVLLSLPFIVVFFSV